MKQRALVLCPGRGSYSRDCLNSLDGLESAGLDVFDKLRADLGRPTVREMDTADRFVSAQHIRGENASSLTAGVSIADLDQINANAFDVVGVIGNSMGWYTALGYAGALPMEDCATLIETMAQYQKGNIIGGQIVYPMVDTQWRLDPAAVANVTATVSGHRDLHWSIRLGGQAVLGGSEEALTFASDSLPSVTQGAHTFPIRLPLHSAFHTELMQSARAQAKLDLAGLRWQSPAIPMVDGSGRVHRAGCANPAAIREYTLGAQVTETYDLTLSIRTALRTVGPDVVILPGPGSNLGSAIAQAMICEKWRGIDSKDAFISRQNTDPVVLSMRWPDQRERVVA
tara:strand:+ start:469 stop:1491 length:1023 start_codon:yes stop_codon:yes gene_type:complete